MDDRLRRAIDRQYGGVSGVARVRTLYDPIRHCYYRATTIDLGRRPPVPPLRTVQKQVSEEIAAQKQSNSRDKRKTGLVDQIIEYLGLNGSSTVPEIAEGIGANAVTVYKTMRRWAGVDWIVVEKNGNTKLWGLK